MDANNTREILMYLAPLIVIQFILIVVCIRSIIKEEVNYLPKWAWALIVFNLFGSIIYLIVGRKRY
jgi:hypothetical protein